jgi:hypothetical protein
MALYPLKGERVSKIVEGITLHFALNHTPEQSREATSLYLGLTPKELSHKGGGSLANRTSVTIERNLGYLIVGKFQGEGDLISAQRVREIDLSIGVE